MAEECLDNAKQTLDLEDQAAWRRLGDDWVKLAEMAELAERRTSISPSPRKPA